MRNVTNRVSAWLDKVEHFLEGNSRFFVVGGGCVVIVCVIFTFLRCFDNTLWGDEAFTARLARLDMHALLESTAMDVHPPLYYIIVKVFVMVFGESGFLYHFISFLPYFLSILLGGLYILKKYNGLSSIIFCLLVSLSPIFVRYNVEIRMYSLSAFFMLGVFISAREVYMNRQKRYYALLTLFATLAVYTHYYCIIMCMIAYFLLACHAFRLKKGIFRVFLSGFIVIIAYAPWLSVLFATFDRTASSWWATEIPKFKEVFTYPLFSSHCLDIVIWIYIIGALLIAVKIIRCKKFFACEIDLLRTSMNNNAFTILLGIAIYFGVAVVGIGVSKVIRPLFILRYLVPASILLYFVIGIGIAEFKRKYLIGVLIIGTILCSMTPEAIRQYRYDATLNIKNEQTVQILRNNITRNTKLLSNSVMVGWTVGSYYFKDMNIKMYSEDEFSKLECNDKNEYLLVWDGVLSDKAKNKIKENGCSVDEIIRDGDGSLGMVNIVGYIIKR